MRFENPLELVDRATKVPGYPDAITNVLRAISEAARHAIDTGEVPEMPLNLLEEGTTALRTNGWRGDNDGDVSCPAHIWDRIIDHPDVHPEPPETGQNSVVYHCRLYVWCADRNLLYVEGML